MAGDDRLDELEARVAALEGNSHPTSSATPLGTAETFWALEGLRERTPPDTSGTVLFTGLVELPTGEHYEWQQAQLVDELAGRDVDQDWTVAAATLAALGHPVRLALLHAVLHGTRTAADLTGLDGMGTTGQVYHHLRLLTGAGWLRATARGHYAVPPDRVVPLLAVLAATRR